jgi:CPA1 family monovalent cation:H+ antiporter
LALSKLLLYGVLFSGFLILLRLLWSFPSAYVAYLFRRRLLSQNDAWPGNRQVFVIGWTGMRGVIALAAAISLPQTLADGTPFPHRNLIVFLTFSVILVTLVLQGLTLPPLIRALGLAAKSGPDCEEQEARRLMLEAALAQLQNRDRTKDAPGSAGLYDDLAKHYAQRLASISNPRDEPITSSRELRGSYLDVSRELLETERQTAIRLRDEGRISDEVWHGLEHELDLRETQFKSSTKDRPAGTH